MKRFLMATLLATATLPALAADATAVFAGGCFWCSEADFEKLKGVTAVVSGYTGGRTPNPTYEAVSSGTTGHLEAVEVRYDPAVVRYEQLLAHFWRHHDFQDGGGQFCDRGEQYGPAIFTGNAAEQAAAERSLAGVQRQTKAPVATRILPRGPFYAAETYHQDYHLKNAYRYKFYRLSCGRDARMDTLTKALR